ncbi:MAG: ribosome-associated toxin RatA of RatAB toxin-antitoxin module [Oleiphilaceae bacterium]|jgi:ribosome-associated toxin RatA of RatAB toxin-antitoxin module
MSLSINRSALVLHSTERMSALVNDIMSYPQFLPWCSQANIIEQSSEFVVACIEVQKGGVRQSFTTRNDLTSDGKILMGLVDGPFKYLNGVWDFIHLKEDACKVVLTLDFELKQNIAKMAFGPIFNQAANSMVDAFCERANQVYR